MRDIRIVPPKHRSSVSKAQSAGASRWIKRRAGMSNAGNPSSAKVGRRNGGSSEGNGVS